MTTDGPAAHDVALWTAFERLGHAYLVQDEHAVRRELALIEVLRERAAAGAADEGAAGTPLVPQVRFRRPAARDVVARLSGRLRSARASRRAGARVGAPPFTRSTHLSDVIASVLHETRAALGPGPVALLLGPVTDEHDGATWTTLTDDGLTTETVGGSDLAAAVAALLPRGEARVVGRSDLDGVTLAAALGHVDAALVAGLTNAAGQVSGCLLGARGDARRRPAARHLRTLGALAGHASVALENGALFAQLRRGMEARAHRALHDSLTDLPNRARLEELLDEAVVGVDGVRNRIGLVVLDLDGFAELSDVFGPASTDALLVQACRRIRELLPGSAELCRIGPNEFAAILRDVDGVDEAIDAARLLIAGFDPPFQVEGVLLALALNVGVAVYPVHAVDVPSLIQRTHIARDTARRLRSGFELYDPTHDPATPRRLAVGAELREAIEGNELDVCFQPKVEVTTGIVRGAEALVRWDHPRLGRVRPSEFIAVAEHTGDIRNLTMVVMRRSLAECRAWRDAGMDLSVAVNLSARNLLDLSLADEVAALLDEARLPPAALVLEFTESMLTSDSRLTTTILEGLAEVGVGLSCDDFGTGYSSLAFLRRLPLDEVKVDRSFIARIADEARDRAIVRSVLALGRDLGLTTVAEGVESAEALELLATLGCDLAQGYYVCPPVPAPRFARWLAEQAADVRVAAPAS